MGSEDEDPGQYMLHNLSVPTEMSIIDISGCGVFICKTHTQTTTHMLIDRENTMNHGGRSCTMAVMVPHPQLWGIETLAKRLCNKAKLLKLEHLVINITY